MQKQGIFLTTLENNDAIVSMANIQRLGCSWLAIRVYGKVKNKLGFWRNQSLNYKDIATLNDKWLSNYFREAQARGIKLWLYADPIGSDPALEMKQLMARMSAYVQHPAFAGALIQVDDMFNKRTVNAVNVYCNTLKNAGITVNWVNVAAELHQEFVDAFNLNTDYGLKLVTSWEECVYDWLEYGIGNRFIPLWPLMDIPGRGYRLDLYKSLSFWKTFMDQDVPAIGLWDTAITYPLKIASQLKWTKGDIVSPVPEPIDEPPVIPADVPTEAECRRILMYLLQRLPI